MAALRDSVTFCSAAANVVTDGTAHKRSSCWTRKPRLRCFGRPCHSNEHYGNMVTYLRLKGIVPPTSDPPKAGSKLYFDLGTASGDHESNWLRLVKDSMFSW